MWYIGGRAFMQQEQKDVLYFPSLGDCPTGTKEAKQLPEMSA